MRALSATGDRWTLLILLALAPGRTRLTHLRGRLPGISTGVLERHIQQTVALGLVTRTRFREMPPRVELELTDAGRELLPVAAALARWGMRHLWSAPSPRERVDVAALLRLLPVLLADRADLPDGLLEAVVADVEGRGGCRYRVSDGRMQCAPCTPDRAPRAPSRTADGAGSSSAAAEPATVTIEGDTNAWIAALGPADERGGLRITGEGRLAERVLDALPRQ